MCIYMYCRSMHAACSNVYKHLRCSEPYQAVSDTYQSILISLAIGSSQRSIGRSPCVFKELMHLFSAHALRNLVGYSIMQPVVMNIFNADVVHFCCVIYRVNLDCGNSVSVF